MCEPTRLLNLSERLLAVICILCFAVMFVLGIAAVFFRFVIESSLAFPEEMMRYLFVWMISLGSAIAFRRNMHAAIGLIVGCLPTGLRRAVLISGTIISGIFFAQIMWSGYQLTLRAVPQISPALEVSMAWVYAAVPVGMGFLILYAIELAVLQARARDEELLADDH